MTQHAPEIIYLQFYGNDDPELLTESEKASIDVHDASWCNEEIYPYDIKYISKDKIDALKQQHDELLADMQSIRSMMLHNGHNNISDVICALDKAIAKAQEVQ
jgi:hypothetical protein